MVNPGGQTLGLRGVAGATLELDGATVTGVNPAAQLNAPGVSLQSSNVTITNSTVSSVNDIGLSSDKVGLADPGSTATVSGSSISGIGRGVSVGGGSSVSLTDTQVTSTGSGAGGVIGDGVGISLQGGTASVQGGSITGSTRGAVLVAGRGTFLAPSLTLDNTTLTGTSSSAILITTVVGTVTNALVTVQNGSTLSSGNGVILEVGQAATAARASNVDFVADDSRLTGNINVIQGSTANIFLRNNATLTGDMTNINSLNVNAGSVTGNVVQSSGSTASVTLANGATYTGALNNVGSLNMDASTLTGSVVQDAATPVAISLNNGSQLTGTVVQGQSMSVDATSTFAMTNDSTVGDLTLNGGTVDMRAGGAAFRTLNATTLTGSGTFALGTDLAGHLSDLVNVSGDANGTYSLRVQNTGVDPLEADAPQKVVHTGGGGAAFSVLGGQVDAGTFVYRLEQQGSEWFLVQATTGGPGPDPGTDPDPGNPGGGGGNPIISPSTTTVIGLFSAAPTVWNGETATLRTRMGELRNGRDQGGVWARTYGNRYQISATDQVDYDQTQSGISFGIDTPVPTADGQWLLGVMGGYSESSIDLHQGSDGRINSYYLGLYSTWLSSSGYYVDALVKANRFQNKADVRMSDGEASKGDYQNYGVGGSVEVGRHIKFAQDWFVEPFVQASALWVQSDSYTLDNGLRARSNGADSFIARAGAHLGKTIALPGAGFAQPYVKFAAAHEFASNNDVKVNSTTFSDDLSGSRAEIGAGLAVQLNPVFQVHADVDYGNGKNIEQPWGVNLGLRYAW